MNRTISPATPRRRLSRTASLTAVSVVGLLLVSGCGANVASEDSHQHRTSITNCGRTTSYPTPQRPVAYDVSAIEKMFSLGLADSMRGIVLPKTVSSVIDKSPYRDDYAKTETISDTVLGQEAVVAGKADWVFAGWQAGFSEERGVTPDSLQKVGINSYMQNETCFNYGEGSADTDPLEATYHDLTDLGQIFGVEDRAEHLVGDLRERQKALREAPRPHTPSNVFVYDSGTTEPYTAGRRTAMTSIVDLAGATSVTGDVDARWDTVGWEPVVKSEPRAIVVVDYNKQPVEEKIDYLTTQSPLKDSPAVRDGNIYVMDYGEAISSPRNIEAAEKLGEYLKARGLR
ncbi:ABC transporter substrate-binding protein [Kocuria massiliensis]|uniref:ABC transporter substrate-binding protein n=1 Tax=Kocuria massiliensis TaxID=1926282 RepID=UPI0022B98392|nr:ABC transporter substrate-binding protein [Kocuria massiliensis]